MSVCPTKERDVCPYQTVGARSSRELETEYQAIWRRKPLVSLTHIKWCLFLFKMQNI